MRLARRLTSSLPSLCSSPPEPGGLREESPALRVNAVSARISSWVWAPGVARVAPRDHRGDAVAHAQHPPGRDDVVLLVRPVTSSGPAASRTSARERLAGIDTGEIVTGPQAGSECGIALLQAVQL